MEKSSPRIIGCETSLSSVFHILKRVAPTDSTVLVSGESGTGKELVVRALHAASRRAQGPFVPVNCGAIPHDLLESELFGHEKGAFTGAVHARQGRFELACGGTIFLDEIGEMDPGLQVKILRVLQEREIERVGGDGPRKVDVRVVAATNRDLEADVAAGLFREDLFYRLNVIPIHLPPLRERGQDILLLAQNFLQQFCLERGRAPLALSPSARRILSAYSWPGNVRELQNFMERLSILVEGDVVDVGDLPDKIIKSTDGMGGLSAEGCRVRENTQTSLATPVQGGTGTGFSWPKLADLDELGLSLKDFLEDLEGRLVDEALAQEEGVRNRAAARLGIKRTTLIEKLRRRGLG